MNKREIKMQDGRYLIFYTFAPRQSAAHDERNVTENPVGAAKESEPAAKPEAEEERSV